MKFSNRFNVPEPLCGALKGKDRSKRDPMRVSVTTIINPPRITVLGERHDKKIVVDVSDRLWMFLGSMGHSVVENASREEDLSEEKLTLKVGDFTVVGVPDLYNEGIVDDYKVTTVWSYIFGLKPEWEAQLNMYGILLRSAGFTVDQLRIVMIFRDWQKSKARYDKEYPQCPIHIMNVPLWDESITMAYMELHLGALQAARELKDDELPMCSKDDRWERGEAYAVKKKGGKKAYRVFRCDAYADAKFEAESLAGTKEEYLVEHRQGVSVRCMDYCDAAPFCSFGKKVLEEANNG